MSSLQRGIERRRLAAAGRAGDEHDAVGIAHHLAQFADRLRLEAELVEVERDLAAVENAQHDAFAMRRRQGRDAEVDVDAANGQLDAAVLRQASLGDVEPGHDLDARGDGGLQSGRQRFGGAQRAVDAIADLHGLERGLDVNVGRARFDGVGDDLVDPPDDRRLIGDVAQPLQVEFAGVIGAGVVVGERNAVLLRAIEGRPGLFELRGRGEAQFDLEAGGIGERLEPAPDRADR